MSLLLSHAVQADELGSIPTTQPGAVEEEDVTNYEEQAQVKQEL